MSKTDKKWKLLDESKYDSIDELINAIAIRRDIVLADANISTLTLNALSINSASVSKAIKRIKVAIETKQQIVIYGDYDVDGITGTAILWETLDALGANVLPYIPHRVDEGYGLSSKGIDNLLEKNPPKLIITVDNGIVATHPVQYAKENGIDVIITDHHLPGDKKDIPDALAIVHTTSLCGSSVALFFAAEILKKLGTFEKHNDEHVILAAIATVADLVPLTGANRMVLKEGLSLIPKNKRIGLKELIKVSGLVDKSIGVYEIGHILSPRLNASGRIESGMDSLRLLCTKDKTRAVLLAQGLDETNRKRQDLMKSSASLAIDALDGKTDSKKILTIVDASFEEGIIGLVAGKLVEKFYLPSVVIARRETVSKGSARSVSGVNIIEILRKLSDQFINVGGHPMAAGFSIETKNIEKLIKDLELIAKKEISEDLLVRVIKVENKIPFSFDFKELYAKLVLLGPFGMANFDPLFLSKKVYVREKRIIGKEGTHVRFVLSEDEISKPYEAIAFGMAEKASEVSQDDLIDIVYSLDSNTWNGSTKIQLKVKDFKKAI